MRDFSTITQIEIDAAAGAWAKAYIRHGSSNVCEPVAALAGGSYEDCADGAAQQSYRRLLQEFELAAVKARHGWRVDTVMGRLAQVLIPGDGYTQSVQWEARMVTIRVRNPQYRDSTHPYVSSVGPGRPLAAIVRIRFSRNILKTDGFAYRLVLTEPLAKPRHVRADGDHYDGLRTTSSWDVLLKVLERDVAQISKDDEANEADREARAEEIRAASRAANDASRAFSDCVHRNSTRVAFLLIAAHDSGQPLPESLARVAAELSQLATADKVATEALETKYQR